MCIKYLCSAVFQGGKHTINHVYYFDNIHSTLYLIDTANPGNTESISFVLRSPVPLDAFSDPQKFIANQGNYCFFNNAYLFDHTLWASFINQGSMCVLVMDLKNKKQFVAKYNSWYPTILSNYNEYFYAAMNVDRILEEETIKTAKNGTQYPIEYDSNPVILRFKPKTIFK